MTILFVVSFPQKWTIDIPNVRIISPKDYLLNSMFTNLKGAKVFNLCRSYSYQSLGYYVSLLAAARGHRCFPNITTVQDQKSPSIIRIISQDI